MKEYSGYRVTLMVCSECNTSCNHCYISYKGNRNPEELKTIAQKLTEKYRVKINGSEVLVNPDYLETYPIVDQDWIMTNGIAVYNDPSLIDKIIENKINKVYVFPFWHR